MVVKSNFDKTKFSQNIKGIVSLITGETKRLKNESKNFLDIASTLSPGQERTNLQFRFAISENNKALKDYIKTVDSAQWSYQHFTEWTQNSGHSVNVFSKVINKAKGFLKGFAVGLANMVIGLAVGKLIEFVAQTIDNHIHKTEKLKEAAQDAGDAIEEEQKKLEDAKSELEEVNEKIDALLMKDSLTFVEEQDLQNLREQKALLEDELRLKKEIIEQNKQDYIEKQKAAYDAEKSEFNPKSIADSDGVIRADQVLDAVWDNDQDTLVEYADEIKAKLAEMKEEGAADAEDLLEANKNISAALTARKQFYSDYLTSISNQGGMTSQEYKDIKADYIDFLKEIGDTATLSTFMDATDGFEDAYKAAADDIKSGKIKTASDLKEAIGTDLYNIFEEACKSVGIKVEDMINNIYADATDNFDKDYLAKKMRQANNNLAGKTVQIGDTNAYRDYLEEIANFTSTLSDEQKQIYLDVVDSATTLAEAKRLYNESTYKNNRQGYIDSHKIPLSTFAEEGRRVTQVNVSKEEANTEFEDFINKLSETDYQIVLKLDVDASQSIEEIQKQIRDSKTEKTLNDVLSETFANADGEDAKLEDIVSTVTSNIDKIKAKIVELNKSGITALSPSELIEFERLAPGITTELDKWNNDSDKVATAMQYLTSAIAAQDDTLETYCNNLINLNNLTPEAATALQTLLDTIRSYEDFESPAEIPDYSKLLSQTFSGSNAGGDLVTISDKVSDLTSKVEVLKTALDTLDTDRIGRAGELMYKNFDDLVDSLDMSSILQNFPELADQIAACNGSAEKLREVFQNALNGIDTGLIDKLNKLKQTTPELTTEIDLLIGQLDKLSNYDINIDLSMDTTQSVIDDYISKMNTLADLAIMTRDSYVVAFDDIRNVSSVFPEIMNGAQILADGTVQLNEQTVNSVIAGSQAEMQASIQARVQELEGQKALVQAKIAYTQAKLLVAEQALESESAADMIAANVKMQNSDSVLNNAIQNGTDEQTAYENATVAMMANDEDFSNYAADVSKGIDLNMANASKSAADNFASAITSMLGNAATAASSFQSLAAVIKGAFAGEVVGYNGSTSVGNNGQYGANGGYTGVKNPGSNHGNYYIPASDLLNQNAQNLAQQMADAAKKQLQDAVNSLKNQLSAYNGSLADINTQIDNLTKIGNMTLDQFTAPKIADQTGKSGGGNGGGGGGNGGGGGGSDSTQAYSERIDWIEKAITRIEEGIQSLDTLASSTYAKFSDRNKSLIQQMEQIHNEITLQQQATQKYLDQANAVGLADEWKKKVQQGAVDIQTITDENLKNLIDEYDNWYTKYRECSINLVKLNDDFSAAYKAAFDLITSEFDTVISQFEAKSSRLNEYISQMETQGYLVGEKYYEALIQNEQARIASLQQEAARLTESLNNAVANGDIKEGSETWAEMRDKINDVNQSILEAQGSILEFNNSIRQLRWDIFDTIQDRISKITDESDFLIELMSNSDLFDDKGKMTDQGLATLGLRGVNYNTYMSEADKYAEEMKRIQADLANDPNNKDLIERRYELLDLQQESILAAEKEKQAIKDLIKDGIEKELDSLQDLIDKYEDVLDSQKDAYSYSKNVKEQKETISSLQKQLLAYTNDDSESGKLNRQQLSSQLKDAQESLEETQYDQYISDSKKMLSDLYDTYEQTLNARLDNLDALISSCIETINANKESINQTLGTVAGNVGYTLTSEMSNIWGDDGSFTKVVSQYKTDLFGKFTTLQAAIDKIVVAVQEMAKASEDKAAEDVSQTDTSVPTQTPDSTPAPSTPSTPSTPSEPAQSTPATGSGNGVPEVGDTVTFTGSYMYTSRGAQPVGSLFAGQENAVRIEKIQEDTPWWHPTHPYLIHAVSNPGPSGALGWVSLDQLKGYKTGSSGIDKDQYAWTQENGVPEAIIRPSDGAIMTPLMKFDSVLNGKATQNLFKLTNNPDKFYRENMISGNSGTSTNTYGAVTVEQQFNITVAGVANYEEFVSKMQKDNKFEKLVQSMTLDVLKGKSTIGKYSIKI